LRVFSAEVRRGGLTSIRWTNWEYVGLSVFSCVALRQRSDRVSRQLPQLEEVLLQSIEGSVFEVGPDYVLWPQESLRTEPEFTTALDDDYVYWYSFNALGAVAITSEGESVTSDAPRTPLVRVNLEDGALQRLDTPGFSLGQESQILGHDAAQLYVSTARG
jgi:hypothetical protein